MVAALRHVVFSLLCLKIKQCEHFHFVVSLCFCFFTFSRLTCKRTTKEGRKYDTFYVSYSRIFASSWRKIENANTQRYDKVKLVDTSCFLHFRLKTLVFSFFRVPLVQAHAHTNSTCQMHRIVALFLSYFRFFASEIQKSKNTKVRQSLWRVFSFLHCCILGRKSENTTWRKSATIIMWFRFKQKKDYFMPFSQRKKKSGVVLY